MDVLACPERLGELKSGYCLTSRCLSGRHHEFVDGKSGYLARLVPVLSRRGGVGVLDPGVDAKYENRLIHRGECGGESALAGVNALFVLAEEQHIDGERNGGGESQ